MGSFTMVWQTVKQEEKSKFKTIKFPLTFNHVSHLARAVGLVKAYKYVYLCMYVCMYWWMLCFSLGGMNIAVLWQTRDLLVCLISSVGCTKL